MTTFKLSCLDPQTNERKTFFYDNQTSELKDENGEAVLNAYPQQWGLSAVTSKEDPIGKESPRILKISLGLSCNYECSYCSQRFVPHAESTNPDDIQEFVNGMDSWVTHTLEKIEFWGGEPLVYWKTLKPLAEALRIKYPQVNFSMVTNGSLLDEEKNQWIDAMGFTIGLSHDGVGYHVRGLDPLDDEVKAKAIYDLYHRLSPFNRISINAMLNKDNTSRAAIQEFLVDRFGADVRIGEGTFVDPYDEGGMAASLLTHADSIAYRNSCLQEIRDGKNNNFLVLNYKVIDFIESIRTARPAKSLGQKCAMDNVDNLAVDLHGNVLTCQNVSAAAISPNMESHLIGHVSNLADVKLKTSTHWSKRTDCPECPVLQLCKGACMFLEGDLWEAGCNNSFSDNIPFFAAAIEALTSFVPYYIEGGNREDRRDLFGLVYGVKEKQQKKVFQIKAI